MSRARLLAPLCLSLALTLAGCGGGGGGGGGSSPPANRPPTAVASAPGSAEPGDTVTLDGSGSSDADGRIASWHWEQVAGPPVSLAGADSPRARFTAPQVNRDSELGFLLEVTDDSGASASTRRTVRVAPPASAARYDLRGTVLASAQQTVDGDTNDPNSAIASNDSPDTAQPLGNPVTLGGYVNQPGSGAEGRSRNAGDIDDYFRVDLLAGQQVTVLVATPDEGDADLYLLDTEGNILDFSIDTGEVEQLFAPADGSYLVNVFAFEGATNYILAIGNPAGALPELQRPPIVAGEAIVEYQPGSAAARQGELSSADLAWRMGLRQRGGGAGRARLLAKLAEGEAGERFGTAGARAGRIQDPALRERWETLIPIKRLRRAPGVRDASPNFRLQPLRLPNDPALDFQWHYPLIDLPAAWDVSTGDPDVVVAVIDTGILPDHPDLRGQLVPGYDFVRDALRAGDGDGLDPDPSDPGNREAPGASVYHGTHVAGTIAAAGDNGIGVAGVAYSARIMPLRALAEDGGTSYDVMQALRYAAGLDNDSGQVPARPADIINLSLGGEGFSSVTQALYRELRAAGVIVVAAAGNEASTLASYPAAYEGVISVSAVDAQGRLTSYSNRGPSIDVAAPGGDSSRDIAGDGYPDGVLSTGASGAGNSLSYAYTFISGTSMAAPHVSGVIALMKAINPALGPAMLDSLLQRGELTVDPGGPGRDDSYGYGLIDAARAVNAALLSRGDQLQVSARLSSPNTALNFGSHQVELELVLEGNGEPPVQVTLIESSETWLTVSTSEIDNRGLGRYRLSVERDDLEPGIYGAYVDVHSSANSLRIPVQMAVGEFAGADLGTLYVLLYHPETDAVVAEVAAQVEGGSYHYHFDDIVAGSYRIYAGTDADNDLQICDPGEACGAWLTTDRPATVELRGDRSGLDFPADYQVSLPSVRSVDAGSAQRPSLPRGH